ncbi:baseplate assembly protein [Chromobacterium vaccinii]|uniref:baseplate assembly protein n=1 Tax=Chromobacterium vaccinii TaxID=1108595 RepID=UPI000617B33A|nr:baseplate J/gp47 family protein [Chromobacterium vaccinii]QND82695.1 Phage baseplate assembly protein J [Chromobacterium vaccinii]QND87925.1 Phage baseplate assembly protein J [Chromobacterium vaccinii]
MNQTTTDLPKFIDDDPQQITNELITAYQNMAGKTLYPGQVERLLIDLIAYRESVARAAFNDAGRQNLVAFARAPMLDYLGELVGVTRLPAQPARSKVSFTFAAGAPQTVVIKRQTLVAGRGDIQFQTIDEAVVNILKDQEVPVTLAVVAVEPGMDGNGQEPGAINQLVDDLSVSVAVRNTEVSAGGADAEDDERLRQRIRLAPESFSVAGSAAAYRHHALRADQSIVDVAVVSANNLEEGGKPEDVPQPGEVWLYPLVSGGLPSDDLRAKVANTCSADRVRPLTDRVSVKPPVEFAYQVAASLQLYAGSDAKQVLQRAQDALQAYLQTQQAKLGNDIVPSQLVAALSVPGVYQVNLQQPAAVQKVPSYGWAHCTNGIAGLTVDSLNNG